MKQNKTRNTAYSMTFCGIKNQTLCRSMALIGMFLFVLILQMKVYAAEKKVQAVLEPGKTYEYNLDQKGENEKIQVTCVNNGKKYRTTVKVNGERLYSKTGKYDDQTVMVVDTDISDKQMELFILDGENRDYAWGSDMKHIYYYRYEKGKMKRVQDLSPLYRKLCVYTSEIHGMSDKKPLVTDGKGKLYSKVCICLPDYKIDYQHVKVGLTFANGKFSFPTKKKVYSLMDYPDPFLLLKDAQVYKTPGGSKKAFTAKKKSEMYLLEMYRKNDKQLYFKIKDGKTGYIDPKKISVELTGTFHA